MVMFPMITGLAQWRVARQALERERLQLGSPPVPVGVLVEVPATALNAERFATEVDFFSLGTNDLAQYTLATDRDHPQLASQVDELDPAVLQLVATTVKAARGHGKWVSVCGGMAADPQAVPLLIGLGVGGLSVSAPAIPGVKACVRRWRLTDAEVLVTRALTAGSAEEVRALVAAADA
jgi:phosphocarrier protein FPr